MTIFSPRASAMEPHVGDEAGEPTVVARLQRTSSSASSSSTPIPFIGVDNSQSPGVALDGSIEELERCVLELGFVGCNLNPDPSGGMWSGPPLTDRYWYPIYEKMIELDVPAMIHVSSSCNRTSTPPAPTTSTPIPPRSCNSSRAISRRLSDVALRHPPRWRRRAVSLGRYRGLADMLDKAPLSEHVMGNVYFDTCVYHQPGIDLLFEVIERKNILFGSEMLRCGARRRPRDRPPLDDTKRYVDALGLNGDQLAEVYEGNARRVYPRLDTALKSRASEWRRSRWTRLARLRRESVTSVVPATRRNRRRPLSRLRPGRRLPIRRGTQVHTV